MSAAPVPGRCAAGRAGEFVNVGPTLAGYVRCDSPATLTVTTECACDHIDSYQVCGQCAAAMLRQTGNGKQPRCVSCLHAADPHECPVGLAVTRLDSVAFVDGRGFPTRHHPESLTAELPEADEEWLATLASALWPADEYVAIVQRDVPGGAP